MSDLREQAMWVTSVELMCWHCLTIIDVGEAVRWNPDTGKPVHAVHGA